MLNQHKTIRDNIAKYNKRFPLVEYLHPFIAGKSSVRIADIGSGPLVTIGHYLDGVDVEVVPADKQRFAKFYEKYTVIPFFPIEHQDMESLTYPDDSFDLVHCANALDHTADAYKAVMEMIRICKPGGWIYIDCCLDQLDTGGGHHWNAKEDGAFVNARQTFSLVELGFSIKFVDNGMERRYNHIIATRQK